MLRKFVWVFAVIASVGTAQASTLTYSSYTVIDGQNVTLSGSALGRQETASAGEVQLLGINGGTGKLATFCIDVADWLTPSGQFSTGAYLIGSFADQVNALLTHVLPTLATNRDASAALQVAIWNAEYGTALTVQSSHSVIDLASTYLGDINSGAWVADPTMQIAVLGGGGKNQTQAYLSPVQEPASIAILALALLGVGAIRYRHRRLNGRC